jgi:hypothetical protein
MIHARAGRRANPGDHTARIRGSIWRDMLDDATSAARSQESKKEKAPPQDGEQNHYIAQGWLYGTNMCRA